LPDERLFFVYGNCIAEKIDILLPDKSLSKSLSEYYFQIIDEEKRFRLISFFCFLASAIVAAIFYILPNLFPFFAPGKRALANQTDFFRKVLFFNVFQSLVVLLVKLLVVIRNLDFLPDCCFSFTRFRQADTIKKNIKQPF